MESSLIKEINNLHLKDDDLILKFQKCEPSSHPDSKVSVLKFSMHNKKNDAEMGFINLRAGYTNNIELYRGNLGFAVNKEFQGNYLSARSCTLLKPVFKICNLPKIWITCNETNIASKKAIEKFGAKYVDRLIMSESYEYLNYYPTPESRIKLRFLYLS